VLIFSYSTNKKIHKLNWAKIFHMYRLVQRSRKKR